LWYKRLVVVLVDRDERLPVQLRRQRVVHPRRTEQDVVRRVGVRPLVDRLSASDELERGLPGGCFEVFEKRDDLVSDRLVLVRRDDPVGVAPLEIDADAHPGPAPTVRRRRRPVHVLPERLPDVIRESLYDPFARPEPLGQHVRLSRGEPELPHR